MIKEIKEKIEKIDPKILIGAAVGGVALLSFFAYKLMSKTKGETPKALPKVAVKRGVSSVSQSRKSQQSAAPEGPERALIRVINQIKKTMPDKDTINYEAVRGIYQGQFELSRTQAQTLIKKNRNQRRKLLGDLKSYLNVVANYEQSLEEIHNANLNAILAYFRIDKGGWIELIEEVSIQNKDDWDQLLVDTEDQEIDSLRQKEKPKLKLPILIQIVKHKAEQLQKKINEFKTNFAGTDPSTLYIMVEKWTEDVTYEKFKVEVEDINYSYKELSEKDKQYLRDHQKIVNELIEGLVLGDQDDEEQQGDNNSQSVHSGSKHSKQANQQQS